MPQTRRISTLGPGILYFGESGSAMDMSAQCTSVKIEFTGESDNPETVLSGAQIAGTRNYTANLSATIFQDLAADGVIDWSWKNRGTEVAVTFVPEKSQKALVEGTVVVDPITLGGDVPNKNKSDFTWQFVTTPTFDPNSDKVENIVSTHG